ncbi:MAG TPA: hypothetical protein VFB38_07315 [Chthonomonadaceae bacterium]|nr:hypothetical protein [Chthonomonadaceae bacterium]
MSIQSGNFPAPITRPAGPDAIQPVGRDANAQEFGQGNRGKRQDGKHRSPDSETPQDVVDVSGDYLKQSGEEAQALPDSAGRASKGGRPSTRALPPERHIDIQV